MKMMKPGLLAMVCAFLLVTTWQQTRGIITENQREFEQKQLLALAGSGSTLNETGSGYDILRNDEVIGAITRHATDKGYNGKIELYLATNSQGRILGADVVYHRETPGLGDKIDDAMSDWIVQFKGRDLNNTKWAIAPAGDIDGITGATITARATMKAIRAGLEQ